MAGLPVKLESRVPFPTASSVFSRRWRWQCCSSGQWRILGEYTAYIFRAEVWPRCCVVLRRMMAWSYRCLQSLGSFWKSGRRKLDSGYRAKEELCSSFWTLLPNFESFFGYMVLTPKQQGWAKQLINRNWCTHSVHVGLTCSYQTAILMDVGGHSSLAERSRVGEGR
jgi:hypothetical protein